MANGAFQLWDLGTGNCAGVYDDEAAALAAIASGVGEDGPDSFDGIALAHVEGTRITDLGQGAALVARARAVTAAAHLTATSARLASD